MVPVSPKGPRLPLRVPVTSQNPYSHGMSYCDVAPGHPLHGPYHDREYGFPLFEDAELFERLALEINQAGLSWLTVLQKREAFRRAFAEFDIDCVSRFGARERGSGERTAGEGSAQRVG